MEIRRTERIAAEKELRFEKNRDTLSKIKGKLKIFELRGAIRMAIDVRSEVRPLKKVLLQRPGRELEQLVPNSMERLLFDDHSLPARRADGA